VAVNEELGALFGGFIVNAKDIDAITICPSRPIR
jgi:hypothetical protein